MWYPDLKFRDYYNNIIVFDAIDASEQVYEQFNGALTKRYFSAMAFLNKECELTFLMIGQGDHQFDCYEAFSTEKPITIVGYDLCFLDCEVVDAPLSIVLQGLQTVETLEIKNEKIKKIMDCTALDNMRDPFFPTSVLAELDSENMSINIYDIDGVIITGKSDKGDIVKSVALNDMMYSVLVAQKKISKEALLAIDKMLEKLYFDEIASQEIDRKEA